MIIIDMLMQVENHDCRIQPGNSEMNHINFIAFDMPVQGDGVSRSKNGIG